MMKWMKVDKKVRFHATDEGEAIFVKNIFGHSAKADVAGNFPRLFPVQEVFQKEKGVLKLVSVGIISPMKNYLLVIEALQEVKLSVHYNIYGPVKDATYWEHCLEAIKKLPPNISVQYHPELPAHKVNAKLNEEAVFILPSKSENYGHAIAEALSVGLPVVTSSNVPWLQLKEKNAGLNVDLSAEAIKDAIEYFAEMDQDEYTKFRQGASTYIRERVETASLKGAYDGMFKRNVQSLRTHEFN